MHDTQPVTSKVGQTCNENNRSAVRGQNTGIQGVKTHMRMEAGNTGNDYIHCLKADANL